MFLSCQRKRINELSVADGSRHVQVCRRHGQQLMAKAADGKLLLQARHVRYNQV